MDKQKEFDEFWHQEYESAVKEWTESSKNFSAVIQLLQDYQHEKKLNGKLKNTIYWLCHELNKYTEEKIDWEELCKHIEVNL